MLTIKRYKPIFLQKYAYISSKYQAPRKVGLITSKHNLMSKNDS